MRMVCANDWLTSRGKSAVSPYIAVDDEAREEFSGVAGHPLVDPLEAFDQAADIIVSVAVLPDLLDDLHYAAAGGRRRIHSHAMPAAEVREQRAVKAIKYDKMALVCILFALAGAAAQHLLQQDARLDWAAAGR